MKKLLVLLSLVVLSGCMKDDIFLPMQEEPIPSALEINGIQGIKLESTIVSDAVKMNVKLPYTGTYRIKIRDIGKKIVSQEEISGKEGDNILDVYVSSLEKDGYTIEIATLNNEILGLTSFVVN